MPLLIGNVVSVLSGIIFSVVITYAFGADQFDWSLLQTDIHTSNDMDVRGMTACQVEEQAQAERISPEMDALLRSGTRKAILATIIFFLSMMVLWPLPMFGTSYIFSKGFFKGWVVSFPKIHLFKDTSSRNSGCYFYLGMGCRPFYHSVAPVAVAIHTPSFLLYMFWV
jgi:hypothetical protein